MFIGPPGVPEKVEQDRVAYPSFCLFWCFLEIGSLVFSKFWHGAITYKRLCVIEANYLEKLFPPKIGKNGSMSFLNLFKKIGIKFLLNLFYNKNLYQLLCSCIYPIFGKNLVPEIRIKMLFANQIAVFLNELYLQNNLMK